MLAKYNIKTIIFEKNKILGKKLLATGNGRCNIHNANTNANEFQSSSFLTNELESILNSFDFKAFEKICKNLGLLLTKTENQKIYPLSNSAKSVLMIFEKHLQQAKNLKILCENEVTKIANFKNGFQLETNNKELHICTHLILACGSQAHPKLGGSAKGLALAKSLQLEILQPYPSLTPLNCNIKSKEQISGVKINAKITLKDSIKILAQTTNDVLFTSYGISGFGVLDISSYCKTKKNLEIILDLLPTLSLQELENHFLHKHNANLSLESILCGILPPKLAKYFMQNFNFTNNTKHIKQLCFLLKNFNLKNIIPYGFEMAEVSGGGVSVKEIDAKTFASKKIKNLFIIGEMLDIVGNRGGHNLAFAWASAWHCAQAILKD